VVVEVFTFRLAPGATEQAFLEADAAVQTDFYYQRPGIVRRTVARSDDTWAAVIFWRTMDDADAAAAAAADHPATRGFGALMDHGSVRVERYETLD